MSPCGERELFELLAQKFPVGKRMDAIAAMEVDDGQGGLDGSSGSLDFTELT